MLKAWILPHPELGRPDGHTTRARVVQAAIPELMVVESADDLGQPWDVAVFDTWAESRLRHFATTLKHNGARLVSIARALKVPPEPGPEWDLVLQPGPYEQQRGQAISPLVDIRSPMPETTDVLVVVSELTDNPWWVYVVEELRRMKLDFKVLSWEPIPGVEVVSGYGPDWISQANLVIGGAGAGTLYETLWAGKRLVAKAFNVEQMTRRRAAMVAGEAVAPADWSIQNAIEVARDWEPMGLRENGTRELVALL